MEHILLSAGYSYHTKPFRSEAEHGHTHYLIRFQSEGICRAVVDGSLQAIGPGDLMLFAPGERYDLRVEPEIQPTGACAVSSGDYYFFCQGDWIAGWWAERRRPQRFTLPLHDSLLAVCRQIVLEHYRGNKTHRQIAEHYMRIFCLMVDREMSEHAVEGKSGRSFLAQRMRHYVEEHALEPFRLEDVARYADLSPSRAGHLFKACFGLSIMQYALQVRLAIARERMLYSTMSLEMIAEMTGFSSYSYFHRTFRAQFGQSPKQFQLEQAGRNPGTGDKP